MFFLKKPRVFFIGFMAFCLSYLGFFPRMFKFFH
jgi:hypothetical protein